MATQAGLIERSVPSVPLAVEEVLTGPVDAKEVIGSKGLLYLADGDSIYFHDGTGWRDTGIGNSIWSDRDRDDLYELDGDGIDVPTIRHRRTRYEPVTVSSDHTTSGESLLFADSSGGSFTITLASDDALDGVVLTVVDTAMAAAENPIHVATEGAEAIHPGGHGRISLEVDGAAVTLRNHDGDWYTDRRRQFERVTTDEASVTEATAFEARPTSTVYAPATAWTRIPFEQLERDDRLEGDVVDDVWSPRETGDYRVTIAAHTAANSAGAGDRVQLAFRPTNGDPVVLAQTERSGTSAHSLCATKTRQLDATTDYEMVFRNRDAADAVQPGRAMTYLEIWREPVGN